MFICVSSECHVSKVRFLTHFYPDEQRVDCKTVRIFCVFKLNERSGTRLKTEGETGERRYRREGKIAWGFDSYLDGLLVFTVGKQTKGYTEVNSFPFWQQAVRD